MSDLQQEFAGLAEESKEMSGKIAEWRNLLHASPELSGKEENTLCFVKKQLQRLKIPYTEVALSEDGMTLTVTMHDTFLSSGTLSKDVDPDFLKEYGSLYPESFPAGELAGSCTLIENADLRQDGNIAVLTVTLADGPIHGRNFGDGYYRFTAETGYTGIADIGPYLRVTLNATNELFAGN